MKTPPKQNQSKITIGKTDNKQTKSTSPDFASIRTHRSVDRYTSKNGNEAGSKNGDFISYVQEISKDLNEKRLKMEQCITLFNLMHSNNMQIRCLHHNNILSLYCLTERRILCVNCIFGITRHRTHKVLPLKDSAKYVSEDNQLLKEIIDTDLKSLEESIRNSQDNTLVLERELKRALEKHQTDYERHFTELKEKFIKEKQLIKFNFNHLILKSKTIQKNIEQFKFKIWETLSKIGIGKRNESNTDQTQIVRQVLCVDLSELTKIKIRKITKKQLEKIVSRGK